MGGGCLEVNLRRMAAGCRGRVVGMVGVVRMVVVRGLMGVSGSESGAGWRGGGERGRAGWSAVASFSACVVSRLGLQERERVVRGVGGTSSVVWTRALTERQSSSRAAMGFRVKMSIGSSDRAASLSGSDGLMPMSVEGFGVAGCAAPFVTSRKDGRRGGGCV